MWQEGKRKTSDKLCGISEGGHVEEDVRDIVTCRQMICCGPFSVVFMS